MDKKKLFFATLSTGLLLSVCWPVSGLTPILFFALIPLFIAEDYWCKGAFKKVHFFLYFYPPFLIWNILTTWWIWNASAGGAVMAIVSNALLMFLTFWLWSASTRKIEANLRVLLFPFFWISFEYLHHNWDLTWPWLTLGNGLAMMSKYIQWYEFTGPFGGSLWILLINALAFLVIKKVYINSESLKENGKLVASLVSLVAFPILLSIVIYKTFQEKFDPVNVVIVQPNIDPYNEKFTTLTQEFQLHKALQLASTEVDQNTDLIVTPETTLPQNINEDEFYLSTEDTIIHKFLQQSPKLKMLMGVSTLKIYNNKSEASETSRKFIDADVYFDMYNTAAYFSNTEKDQFYHKSRLVPGVEKMPFPKFFKIFESFAIELGGTSGSLGTQKEPGVFKTKKDKLCVAPIICYESIYGGLVGEFVRKGANVIGIITNDGWWGDTPGYKQHLNYARLLAIEHRRSVVRSANTGISAIINQSGEITQTTQWWEEATIKDKVNLNNELTIYSRFGDWIAIIMLLGSAVTMGVSVVKRKK